ncbi:helix-turn-helix domain-containing protein [Deinococcus alpinitundrae]|uniref:helix-turn-helix domain-containing protein n=1 Tax=Deinococcus alpinitundrae TaxID=468913 RepID=UPI001379F0CD
MQARLQRAGQQLGAGHLPAQVALATGFSGQSAFSNQFKRHLGVTPGRYRRELPPEP